MIFIFLLSCLSQLNLGSDIIQKESDIGIAEINIVEGEFHLLIEGFFLFDDSLKSVPEKLSYYFVVNGKSAEDEPDIYKEHRNFFNPYENIQKPIYSITIDTRDTLYVSLKIKNENSVVARKEMIWILPKPTVKPSQRVTTLDSDILKEKEEKKEKEYSEVEIDGLIIDETKTKAGRDFYELFYNNWIAPRKAKYFTIYIAEEPARGRSTIIRVSINNEHVVFRQFLQSRYEIIEELSDNAIGATYRKLRILERIRNDIEDGDLRGNGIY
jgi:curli production assembly/transport component CsgE